MKDKNRQDKIPIHVDYIDRDTHSIFPQYDPNPENKSDVQDPVLDDPSNRSQPDSANIPRYEDYVTERQAELAEESAAEGNLEKLSDDEPEEYGSYIFKRVGAGALIGLVLTAGAIGARSYTENRAETSTSGPAVPGSGEQGSGSARENYVTTISEAEREKLSEDARERSLEQISTIKKNANNIQINDKTHAYSKTDPKGTSTLKITRDSPKTTDGSSGGSHTIRVVTTHTSLEGTKTTSTTFETDSTVGDPVDALRDSDTELAAYSEQTTNRDGTSDTSIVFMEDGVHIATQSTGKDQKTSTRDILASVGKSDPSWAR